MEGKTHGTVSDSGWSNNEMFRKHVEHHLVKYLLERCSKHLFYCYIMLTGHKLHITQSLIDWARNEHIILLVLPAHTSHVLQPFNVDCFGPFKRFCLIMCLTAL